MRRRKQIVFYGIMVVLTLAVIEGMAQAAYYIAYGEFNGGGRSRFQPAAADAVAAVEYRDPGPAIIHPYYGFTRLETPELNQAPPRREDGVVLIGLVGSSVAYDVVPALRSALAAWFRDNDIPLRPVVIELAAGGFKQPQQVMIIANTLSLGGEYDIIVNLDGHNELIFARDNYFDDGVFPFYPAWWQDRVSGWLTDPQKLLIGRIYTRRQREQRLLTLATAEPWRRLALYGIVNRYLLERVAGQIVALNHELADTVPGEYQLVRHGPPLATNPDEYDLSRMALRMWYNGSALLAGLSRDAGAEYYHFLQPNQYVPDAKPLNNWELADAYAADDVRVGVYRVAYPLLRRLGGELSQQGINYYDLTQIFADHGETLYKDDCCHLNTRGNELLAASMVRRLEPALRRRAALATAKVGGGGGMA